MYPKLPLLSAPNLPDGTGQHLETSTVNDVMECEDLLAMDENGNTVIHRVAGNVNVTQKDFDRVVDYVIDEREAGAVFLVTNNSDQTPLHVKFSTGAKNLISKHALKRILSVVGMDIQAKDMHGNTIQALAFAQGNIDIFRVVLESTISVVKPSLMEFGAGLCKAFLNIKKDEDDSD